MRAALENIPDLPEWQDKTFHERQGWPSWSQALRTVHSPDGGSALSSESRAARLAYDELLANQLALQIMREKMKQRPGREIKGDGRLRAEVEKALPFTGSQRVALSEIGGDMAAPSTMLRLLQGDVGSGKTIVALFAMLDAVECGGQAALMVPTEILARQHMATIEPLVAPLGLKLRS